MNIVFSYHGIAYKPLHRLRLRSRSDDGGVVQAVAPQCLVNVMPSCNRWMQFLDPGYAQGT